MRRFAQCFSVILLFCSLTIDQARGQEDRDPAFPTPTKSEDVQEILKRVTQGDFDPPSGEQIERMLKNLSNDRFLVREKATVKLINLLFPPVDRLQTVRKNGDLEARVRADRILKIVQGRPHPLALTFQFARDHQVDIDSELFLKVLRKCQRDPQLWNAGVTTLIANAKAKDLKLAKRLLKEKTPEDKGIGLRLLAKLEKDKAIPTIQKFLESDDPQLREMAVMALLDAGDTLDLGKLENVLEPLALARVYRQAESLFRKRHKEDRTKEINARHQKLLEQYVAVLDKLKVTEHKKMKRRNGNYWIKLGLDTSKHPEIVMYRIRWFRGGWSGWYVPGFNDRHSDKKRAIRYWACFSDHEHEVVIVRDEQLERPILDLP